MNIRRGIILAGGSGSRLYPLTSPISKQLLPVYNKPMVYYPLATLMRAGIRDVLLITTKRDLGNYARLLNDGSHLGINIEYAVQERPDGIAQAFIIGKEFIGTNPVVLALGDNIIYGKDIQHILTKTAESQEGATIFGYEVDNPLRYGVIELLNNKPVSIEEKPVYPKSNYAVPGLYFYDNAVLDIANNLRPSNRGELEITDINREYLNRGQLRVEVLDKNYYWFDAGTYEALIEASIFIKNTEDKLGQQVAAIEEVAYRLGYITSEQLESMATAIGNKYGEYLLNILRK